MKYGILAAMAVLASGSAYGAVVQYGDADLCNTGTYGSDPTAGAATIGLGAGVVNLGSQAFGHGFPFSPQTGEFAGTDQIYVGSVQTGGHDGYSGFGGRVNGPQVLRLDYSSLVGAGEEIGTFTLGIMTDDFQRPTFGQAFSATVNGVAFQALTEALNALDETGPTARFVSIGLSVDQLVSGGVLELSINQGGDGGDGWAVDFLTVGITTVPTPSAAMLLGAAGVMGARRRRSV